MAVYAFIIKPVLSLRGEALSEGNFASEVVLNVLRTIFPIYNTFHVAVQQNFELKELNNC